MYICVCSKVSIEKQYRFIRRSKMATCQLHTAEPTW